MKEFIKIDENLYISITDITKILKSGDNWWIDMNETTYQIDETIVKKILKKIKIIK